MPLSQRLTRTYITQREIPRQSLHCIQYKIVVVYSFGNKKMATTKCHFSYSAISTGKKQQWFLLSITIFHQVKMITSKMYFIWFYLGVHVFHIMSILNIKTCSFQFHFPSVFMPAKNFSVENAFV